MSPSGKRRLGRISKAEATTDQGVNEFACGREESLVCSRSRRKEGAGTSVWRPKDVLTLVACLLLFALVLISMVLRDANSGTVLIAYLAVVTSIVRV